MPTRIDKKYFVQYIVPLPKNTSDSSITWLNTNSIFVDHKAGFPAILKILQHLNSSRNLIQTMEDIVLHVYIVLNNSVQHIFGLLLRSHERATDMQIFGYQRPNRDR